MNNKRIHELIGRIIDKDQEKVYTGKYAGSHYYKLNVLIENKEVKVLFAFQDFIEQEKIWQDIIESNYIDKRYLFYCERRRNGYALKN